MEKLRYEVIISGTDFGKRKTDVIPGLYRDTDGKLYLDALELENLSQQARNRKIGARKSEYSSPYRKPTQVVEESILRRSSDSWLRN